MGLSFRKSLADGAEIALWHITESEDELIGILSGRPAGGGDPCAEPNGPPSEEIAEIRAVGSATLRRQKFAALALIRILCGGGCRLGHRSDGSPYLYIYGDAGKRETAALPEISISHTADYAAILVSPAARPGIDMEFVGRDFSSVGRRALSAREISWLNGDAPQGDAEPRDVQTDKPRTEPGNLRLGIIWCAKEAVYKVIGREVLDFASTITVLPFTPGAEGSLIAEFGSGSLALSYAVRDSLILVWTDGLHI